MSWTFSTASTLKEDFPAAVDAAEASGQDQTLPGVAEDVAAAKDALKALAKQVKRPMVSGSAYGHTLQADEGSNWADSFAVSVNGSEPEPK